MSARSLTWIGLVMLAAAEAAVFAYAIIPDVSDEYRLFLIEGAGRCHWGDEPADATERLMYCDGAAPQRIERGPVSSGTAL